ncbi:MAG: hypothetical protein JSR54_05550 [Proteobacteria bacterium]|nr:hypothetical protein [Pseudomonadota bacterium]
MTAHPALQHWYRSERGGPPFEVVGYDPAAGRVVVRPYRGAPVRLDERRWRDLAPRAVLPPGGRSPAAPAEVPEEDLDSTQPLPILTDADAAEFSDNSG